MDNQHAAFLNAHNKLVSTFIKFNISYSRDKENLKALVHRRNVVIIIILTECIIFLSKLLHFLIMFDEKTPCTN